MFATIADSRLELLDGDITTQAVDAIVNAANSRLAGGGGVDGAIHRRAGTAIMEETARRYPDGCPTGSAVITGAGKLTAQFVIHAVGPRWAGGNRNEAPLLESAYRQALELAIEHGCRTIALPALSTGAYGFPIGPASRIALATTAKVLRQPQCTLELLRFVLFGEPAYQVFAAALKDLTASAS